jgi:hypothetical protein
MRPPGPSSQHAFKPNAVKHPYEAQFITGQLAGKFTPVMEIPGSVQEKSSSNSTFFSLICALEFVVRNPTFTFEVEQVSPSPSTLNLTLESVHGVSPGLPLVLPFADARNEVQANDVFIRDLEGAAGPESRNKKFAAHGRLLNTGVFIFIRSTV